MSNSIAISILANASQAKKEVGGFASGLKSSFGKVGAAIAAAGIATATVAIAKSCVDAASAAQQSLGATQTVFGKSADTIIKKSNQAATAVGLSANQYRENANLIGSLFANQGLAGAALAKQTDAMIKRGSDLAAVFGGTTKDAVEALSSAYKGEFDPLERYGISMKASAVSTEAMRIANVSSAKQWGALSTAQQRAATQQATTSLITQQSAKAQGQFSAQTSTLAEQQQILGAQFENIKAKVGTALLPVLTTLFVWISTRLGPAFATLTAWISANLVPVFQSATTWIQANLVPVFAQVSAFVTGQLVPAFVALGQRIATNLQPVLRQLGQMWTNTLLPALRKIIAAFITWWPTINRVATIAITLGTAIAGKVLPIVLKFAGFLISTAVPAVLGLIGVYVKIIAKVIDFGAAIGNAVSAVAKFVNGLREKFAKAVTFVTGIPGKVTSALGDLGSLLLDAGKQIIQGLIDGIGSMIGKLTDKLHGITKLIPLHKGPIQKDRRLLTPAGKAIMGGLIAGILSRKNELVQHLGILGGAIPKHLADGITKGKHGLVVANQKMLDEISKAADQTIATIQKKIDKAQAALDFGNSVSSAISGAFDISSAGADADGVVSLAGILGDAHLAAAKAAAFAADVGELAGRGISKAYIQQLAAAGPAALDQVEALMTATPEQIKALNENARQTLAAAKALGQQLSKQFYGIGTDAAQGFIDGLTAMQNQITNAVSKVTVKKPVKQAKKDSQTHSPSRLWQQFGIDQMRGLVLGVTSQGKTVETTASRLSARLQRGWSSPELSAVTALDTASSDTTGNDQIANLLGALLAAITGQANAQASQHLALLNALLEAFQRAGEGAGTAIRGAAVNGMNTRPTW